jgi:hypothetical protein
MSGSGGGGYGGVFSTDDVACDRLAFDTQLSSPKASVVAHINVGDVLLVALDQQGTAQVVVIKRDKDIAGGITSPKMARLLECIRQGANYQATVTAKSDGQVTLRISPLR